MFEFLKNLFSRKKEEPDVFIPPAYIAPKKKSTNIDDLLKENSTHADLSETDDALNSLINKASYKNENYKLLQQDEEGLFDQEEEDYSKGYAIVTVNFKQGIKNTYGVFCLDPVYDYIHEEFEGLLKVEKAQRYGFVKPDGTIVIPIEYLDAGEFSEGLVRLEKKVEDYTASGFVDKENNVVVDFKFDYCGDFSEGLASATQYAQKEGDKDIYGFIDRTGDFVIKMDYDDCGDFKEGLAPVCTDGKFTFINKRGRPVCEAVYNDAGNFYKGLSSVQQESGGRWGFADKTGRLVVPCIFDDSADNLEEEEREDFVMEVRKKYSV